MEAYGGYGPHHNKQPPPQKKCVSILQLWCHPGVQETQQSNLSCWYGNLVYIHPEFGLVLFFFFTLKYRLPAGGILYLCETLKIALWSRKCD